MLLHQPSRHPLSSAPCDSSLQRSGKLLRGHSHNTVKNIVQAATKVSHYKIKKNLKSKLTSWWKTSRLMLCVRPCSLWLLIPSPSTPVLFNMQHQQRASRKQLNTNFALSAVPCLSVLIRHTSLIAENQTFPSSTARQRSSTLISYPLTRG